MVVTSVKFAEAAQADVLTWPVFTVAGRTSSVNDGGSASNKAACGI